MVFFIMIDELGGVSWNEFLIYGILVDIICLVSGYCVFILWIYENFYMSLFYFGKLFVILFSKKIIDYVVILCINFN